MLKIALNVNGSTVVKDKIDWSTDNMRRAFKQISASYPIKSVQILKLQGADDVVNEFFWLLADEIQSHGALEEIDFQGFKKIDNLETSSLVKIANKCSKLRKLTLHRLIKLTNETSKALVRFLCMIFFQQPPLEHLNTRAFIENSVFDTEISVAFDSTTFISLRTLNMGWNHFLWHNETAANILFEFIWRQSSLEELHI